MKLVHTTIALLTAAAACQAQSTRPAEEFRQHGRWTASDLGGGGFVMGVAVAASDPTVCYSWNDVGGFHRSDDGGRTWHALHGNLPTTRANYYTGELLVDPRDADRIVVQTGYRYLPRTGVYVSDDGGRTFRNTLPILLASEVGRWSGSTMARHAGDPDRLAVAGTIDGVWTSADNGETWREAGMKGVHPRDLDVDRADPDRMWIVAGAFEDYVADEYKPGFPVEDGKLRLPGGLHRTDDGGATWERLADEAADFWQVIQDPTDADVLYAITDGQGRVRRSGDGGATWSEFAEGLTLADAALPSHPVAECYQILATAGEGVIVGSAVGDLYRLDRDAGRWDKIVAEAVEVPDDWWGATRDDPVYGSDWIDVFKATCSLSVDPNDAERWYMTDWYSIYETRDGGRTWRWSTEGLEDTYVQELEQDPSDPRVVHAGLADIGYFRSEDGGRRFLGRSNDAVVTNNVRSLSVPASRPERVYAASCEVPGGGWWAGIIFASDDKGVTWRRTAMNGLPEMSEGGHHGNTVLALDDEPDAVYLCVSGPVGPGGGGLYRSDDGGESWAYQDVGLPAGEAFFRENIWGGGQDLAVSPDGSMVATKHTHENNSAEGNVWFKPAGSAKFEKAPGTFDPQDVKADPHADGRFYLSARGSGLFRSDDGGATWRELDLPAGTPVPANVIVDRVVPGRLAVSTSDGFALSTDAGDSWRALDKSVPHRVQFGMGAFAGDRLVVGTGGSGLFWIDVGEPAATQGDPE